MFLQCTDTIQCVIQHPLLHDRLQIKSSTDTEITTGFQSIQSLFGVCSKKWLRQQKHMWLYKHTRLQVYYNMHLNLYSKETHWYIIWNINQHLEYSAIIAMKACVHKASLFEWSVWSDFTTVFRLNFCHSIMTLSIPGEHHSPWGLQPDPKPAVMFPTQGTQQGVVVCIGERVWNCKNS